MASSQVEIAAASPPFGCVLRDHNRRDGCNRDFRKNIKDLVRDHLHTCLPDDHSSHKPIVTNNDNDGTKNTTNNRSDRPKLRLLRGSNGIDGDRDGEEFSPSSASASQQTPRQARGFDRWAPQQSGDMVSSTMEIPSPSSPSPSSSSCTPNSQSQLEAGNNNSGVGGGASSLVQMWEARLNRSTSINRNNNINITIDITHNNVNHIGGGGSNSSSSVLGGCSRSPKSNASANVEDSSRACDPESCDRMVVSEDSSPPLSSSSSIADSAGAGGGGGGEGQKQKVRVADIIRRLTTSDNDHEPNGSSGSPSVSDHTEAQRGLVPVVSSPRIRGRQAFSDLLMQMERDRHRELGSLSERRAVSQFSHKGRIQSMLKVRLLQRGVAGRDEHRLGASGGNSSPHNSSAVLHLRERFSTASEHDQGDQNHPVEPRSSPRHPPLKNSCASNTQHQNSHHQTEHSCTSPISSSARPIEDLRDGANPTSNAIYEGGASLRSGNSNLELERPTGASRDLHEQASHASTVAWEDNRRVESSDGNLELERPAEASGALHERASQASTVVCEDNRRVESSNSNLELERPAEASRALHEQASQASTLVCEDKRRVESSNGSLGTQQTTVVLSLPQEVASPTSDVVSQGRSSECCDRNDVQREAATDALASLSVWYEDEITEEQDTDNADEEEEWCRESGGRYDWFSDICRPRSYWEDRRQEWYREMLGTNSVNEEIRQLIERGRVSSYLSSDFRERMDNLMASHLQRQTQPLGHQEEEEQDDLSSQERVEQLMSSLLQGHEHPIGNRQGEGEHEEVRQQEEEEEGDAPDEDERGYIIEDEEDNGNVHEDETEDDDDENDEEMEDDQEVEGHEEEEEEGGSLIGHRYHEASDYFDQATSSFYMPSQSLRSWSFNDNETNDDHEQVASTSSDQPPPSHSYYQDPQQHSTCMDNLSMEMELIIDLRGQMRQLQREMSELRKSIKSCMEMQVTLQDSMKQEMSSARGDAARSVDKIPRKGNCCICYEKQVDSLLYRCGHMCACLKCAHELQWSSGKCPICRAAIVDVVRAYTGS